ncbi:MAG: type I-G CRISPR-associated RAMP protein Csb1/Cas7g, partial [Longimicrobiales bacterium]
AQIRAFGMGPEVERMLVALALFKIARFLEHGLRLRTACDLTVERGPEVTRPNGFAFPSLTDLEQQLPELIREVANAGRFSEPSVTMVTYRR